MKHQIETFVDGEWRPMGNPFRAREPARLAAKTLRLGGHKVRINSTGVRMPKNKPRFVAMHVRVADMIHALQSEPHTEVELRIVAGGMASSTARQWLKAMHTATKYRPKLIHIAWWELNSFGTPSIPVYGWGDKEDARRPPKKTEAERQAACRVRRAQRYILSTTIGAQQ